MSGVGRLRRDMAGRECRGRGGAVGVGDLISVAVAPRQHVRTVRIDTASGRRQLAESASTHRVHLRGLSG